MDGAENWGDSEYGGGWFQTAMHEIGHNLGLGHTYDLSNLTIMGGFGTGEPVFPGDNDLIHGRYLFKPESTDIDLYRFEITEAGWFTAEVVAERFEPDSSLLDSVVDALPGGRLDHSQRHGPQRRLLQRGLVHRPPTGAGGLLSGGHQHGQHRFRPRNPRHRIRRDHGRALRPALESDSRSALQPVGRRRFGPGRRRGRRGGRRVRLLVPERRHDLCGQVCAGGRRRLVVGAFPPH